MTQPRQSVNMRPLCMQSSLSSTPIYACIASSPIYTTTAPTIAAASPSKLNPCPALLLKALPELCAAAAEDELEGFELVALAPDDDAPPLEPVAAAPANETVPVGLVVASVEHVKLLGRV